MNYFRVGLILLVSFVLIGGGITVATFTMPSVNLALFGLLYIAVAIFVNFCYTAFLLVQLLRSKLSARTTLRIVGLIAITIPLALIYSYIITRQININ